ncbi:MAG: ribulose-phosphate 3-epimerase [Syntrophaceae bacterium]|nr:ribulose-phosphate 3-epimerase [Syntrophaceae bacterium]
MVKVAPSILAADFLKLGEEIKAVEQAGADRLHIDVMDGRFVPNITMGIPVVKSLRRGTRLPFEVHLMIEQPENYLEAFSQAGADLLIVQQENSVHLDRTLQAIRDLPKKAGVALNPATPAGVLEEIIEKLDLILVMTVNPGFGGQKFLEYPLKKIESLRRTLDRRNPSCELEVDGGIDPRNARRVAKAGADVLVAGTSVFAHAGGPEAGVRSLLQAVREK